LFVHLFKSGYQLNENVSPNLGNLQGINDAKNAANGTTVFYVYVNRTKNKLFGSLYIRANPLMLVVRTHENFHLIPPIPVQLPFDSKPFQYGSEGLLNNCKRYNNGPILQAEQGCVRMDYQEHHRKEHKTLPAEQKFPFAS
jgi:hypothetical protein